MRSISKLGLRLSIIVTTYNNPYALSLVLASLARQTIREFELLIADDGSGPETKEIIDTFKSKSPFPINHIWHQDTGFRKCTILNKAILVSEGNYFIFLDGDCIPMAHWIETHCRVAKPNRYVSGGKVLLSERFTKQCTVASVEHGDLECVGLWWLETKRLKRLIISKLPGVRFLSDRCLKRRPPWLGENSSTFAEHVYEVSGFDERFTYGYEDRDFGHRLAAAGILGYSIRYTAPVLHLAHPRPYSKADEIFRNKHLMLQNCAVRLTKTPYGLPSRKPHL